MQEIIFVRCVLLRCLTTNEDANQVHNNQQFDHEDNSRDISIGCGGGSDDGGAHGPGDGGEGGHGGGGCDKGC
ncbi:hypothetical protein L6452_00544 [Arctium lappa]|uniref:Uncharacterized protein n=1 Tax=Arctium lappa TaxID=4217 RepID=A0ACB9FE63_ARCLA|nr:hypothetical protein L6452_00544 [Arctium lappa]